MYTKVRKKVGKEEQMEERKGKQKASDGERSS